MATLNIKNIKDIFTDVLSISKQIDKNRQSLLNIENKTRTSIFPWRGQFSPQLIEHILNENSQPNFRILDPFCGSGTTLYESVRCGLSCYGSDINPAAYLFSSIVRFSNLHNDERKNISNKISTIANKTISYVQ